MNSRRKNHPLPYQVMDSDCLQALIDSCQDWHDPKSRTYHDAFVGEKMRRLFGIQRIEETIPDLNETAHRQTRLRCLDTETLEAVAASQTDNTDPFALHILQDCATELVRREYPGQKILRFRLRVKIGPGPAPKTG